MIREHLPEHRQQGFIGDDALPGRFQPAHASVFQLGGEHLAQHVFPRIELEQVADNLVLHIRKLAFFTQADVLDIEELGRHFRFGGAVLEILNRATVFFRIAAAGEMQQVEAKLFAQLGKTRNQLFLQAVELVAAFRQVSGISLVFQPNPLEERRFVQRGWRIRVVFQKLWFTFTVPRQIEAGVKRRLIRFPRLADEAPGVLRNAEFGHQLVAVDDFFHHFQAHLVQLGRHLFQFFNLGERELVIGVFTPVRLAVHGVEVKTVLGGFFAPVRTLGDTHSFHDQPPIEREEEVPVALRCMLVCFATDSPNPPRVMVLVVAGFGAIAVFGTVTVRPGVAAP
ncbi:Uncharacterised protein [Enterobacter cloacae]|nr:Uncharacterised protein [Enterobacter cloacae]